MKKSPRFPLLLGLFVGLSAVILLLFCAVSAKRTRAVPDLSYRSQAFTLRLEGNLHGVDVTCDISCENGRLQRLTYLAPDSVRGLAVTCLESGDIRVERGDISAVFEANAREISGLLLPAHALLPSEESLRSVQKISTGYLLTLESPGGGAPITLALGNDGFPSAVSGESFSFRVENRSDFLPFDP